MLSLIFLVFMGCSYGAVGGGASHGPCKPPNSRGLNSPPFHAFLDFLDDCKRVDEYDGALCRLYQVCNEYESVETRPGRKDAAGRRLGRLDKEIDVFFNGRKAGVLTR